MEFLETNYEWALNKMDEIHFIGGGAYFIDKTYADNFVIHEDSEYFNAIGNLLYINGEEHA